jgi:hypothetical protein
MEVEVNEPIDIQAIVATIAKMTEIWPAVEQVIRDVVSALVPVVQNLVAFFEDAARLVLPDRIGIPESDIRSVTFSDPIIVKTYNWRTIEVPMLDLLP